MAARIYSQFPERKVTHDTGRPTAGSPLPTRAPEQPAADWPKGPVSPSPMAPLAGEKPKAGGGRFYL